MMRIVPFSAGAIVAIAVFGSERAAAADPTGTWLTEDGRARVRTEHCGPRDAQLCGYVVWARKSDDGKAKPRLDEENPDVGKRKRPVLGHQMILGLVPNAERQYEGRIYNADNGKSYDVTIWSETPAALSVRGCMFSYLCQTQIWKRVTDMAPGQLIGPTDGPGGPRADREWSYATPAMTSSTISPKIPPRAPSSPPAR
ncbi:DUF2147 domain-containing protein [Methylobacterium sp. NPDC080182]|uniref:DUF2147 domain-containing protein n=1 Tax=Methylobacterium sp. NPDC080182 TaxID=3390590 RepID=UPI003CFFD264